MERFRADALAIGCLVGFKHFSTSTRGREELLVTVRHGDDATEDGGAPEGGHRGGSDEEGTSLGDDDSTTFLVSPPIVWRLRSSPNAEDVALELDAARDGGDVRAHAIVRELVNVCVFPNPANALELDAMAPSAGEVTEDERRRRCLAAAATAAYLRDVSFDARARGETAFATMVEADARAMVAAHVKSIPEDVLARFR